jgi:hypothetical protein
VDEIVNGQGAIDGLPSRHCNGVIK